MAHHIRDNGRACSPASVKDLFYGSVTIGERGQIVIPAEARRQHGLEPGDKLLVFRHPHYPGVVLARLDDVHELLQQMQAWTEVVSQIHAAAAAPGAEPSEPETRRED